MAGLYDQVPVVFPTCVGVFLSFLMNPDKAVGLPHVRGGVSDKMIVDWGDGTSSPRAWGCFYLKEDMTLRIVVFPTCVGVFPEDEARELTDAGLPHVRGGVS